MFCFVFCKVNDCLEQAVQIKFVIGKLLEPFQLFKKIRVILIDLCDQFRMQAQIMNTMVFATRFSFTRPYRSMFPTICVTAAGDTFK